MFKVTERFVSKRKTRKTFTKLLSIGVSTSMMLAMVPNNGASAAEPDFFYKEAYANHWGRSDLRAYLNNVEKVDDTLPIDTTINGSNSANYPSYFSAAEYGTVESFKYSTNVLNRIEEATAVYETTDKFWLPSAHYNNDQVISWAEEDISSNSQYTMTTATDRRRIIPIPYWSYSASYYSWLRSPSPRSNINALYVLPGDCVSYDRVNYYRPAVSAAFKINLSSVIFASAASAKDIVGSETEGAEVITIGGSSDFGKKTDAKLPDYGMYLKTKAADNVTFTPGDTLTYNSTAKTLTVPYSDGVAGQYVVVHAFKEDSLKDGTTSYTAATKLNVPNSSAAIDVSDWGLSSLDGYTIKVWMEDDSGSLAAATTPYTFVGSGGSISKITDGSETKNTRVFAMKDELQTSWGDLSSLSDEEYENVIAGKGQDGTNGNESNSVHGVNPTNQKIYFGSNNGEPLQFWIAGRETAANGGTVSSDGNIMTLYQAKSVKQVEFNASAKRYKENLNVLKTTVELLNGQKQNIVVRGGYDVLPIGTQLVVNVVPDSPELDRQDNEIEKQFHYEITLLDEDGKPLSMPLKQKVELLFEVVDGLDKDDLEVILAKVGDDIQFEEYLIKIDGVDYVGIYTDHFSPYTLVDKLTDEEKAAMMKTGDEVTYFTVAGLGLIMTLALGLMINSKLNKKKSDE